MGLWVLTRPSIIQLINAKQKLWPKTKASLKSIISNHEKLTSMGFKGYLTTC